MPQIECMVRTACALSLSFLCLSIAAGSGSANDPGSRPAPANGQEISADSTTQTTAGSSAPRGVPVVLGTLPPGANFQKHATAPGRTVVSGDVPRVDHASKRGPSKLVYENTMGRFVFGPSATQRVADDITIASVSGCALDKFVFRVSGDEDNDPAVDHGPFTVDYALYSACPGAKICRPWDVNCPPLIGGTSGSITLPDEGFHEVTVLIPPQVCRGGFNDGRACSTDVDCQPTCVGGTSDGAPCRSFEDCPGGDCDISQVGLCSDRVSLPSSFYFAVTFDRQNAGIVVGAPATLGVSADRYSGSSGCSSAFGGFPEGPHASFDVQFYVRGECADAFPGYHNSMQGGSPYSPGADRFFAEDIQLGTDVCNMVGYEVRFKGSRSNSQGTVEVALHTSLDPLAPRTGGRIQGTRMQSLVWDTDVRVFRRVFSTPILLPAQELWAVFRTTVDTVGPIHTCKEAVVGSTADTVHVYEGDAPSGSWVPWDLSWCHSALDVTIYCDGKAPIGACCDRYMTEGNTCYGGPQDGLPCVSDSNCRCPSGSAGCTSGRCIGDAVCREVPIWACSTPDQWQKGIHCGPVCLGGANNDQPCASDADCPGGSCEGPFCVGGVHDTQACTREADCPGGDCVGGPFPLSCGIGQCCTNDDWCLDVTERECFDRPPGQEGHLFEPAQTCEGGFGDCPYTACFGNDAEVACTLPRPEPGCEESCCQEVCRRDSFCCLVAWDEDCVVWTQGVCRRPYSFNSECYAAWEDGGARLINVRDTVIAGNVGADRGFHPDPEFCCLGGSSPRGRGTIWYRFVAPQPADPADTTVSVSVSTCGTMSLPQFQATDTVIQVLSVAEPDRGLCTDGSQCSVDAQDCADGTPCVFDEAAACSSLATMACDDDAGEVCVGPNGEPAPTHARVCLPDLVPGDMYYVVIGSKTDDDRGAMQISIQSPCEVLARPHIPNDECPDAEVLIGENLGTRFDLSGGTTYPSATLDCVVNECSFTRFKHDIWYDWVAPADGTVTMKACPDGTFWDREVVFAVYEGCACPPDTTRPPICVYGFPTPCSGGVTGTFDVTENTCYKIRLGGDELRASTGEVTINLERTCPDASSIEFLSPPVGVTDARQPHPPSPPMVPQGIDRFVVRGPPNTGVMACWSLCEFGLPFETPSTFFSNIIDHSDGTFSLVLDRPLYPGEVARLKYTDAAGGVVGSSVMVLPGDVNGDGVSDATDVKRMLGVLRGDVASVWGIYSEDIDRSGALSPADLLRLIDLLQGAQAYSPGWNGRSAPAEAEPCP